MTPEHTQPNPPAGAGKRLLLTRHGETDWNAALRIQGQTDTELNATGRAQAEELAARLVQSGERITRIFTSPQKRALETARTVGRALGLDPVPLEGLREVCFGQWEGCTWEEISRRWPQLHLQYIAQRLETVPPEGESYQDLLERLLPAMKTVEQGEGTALVVAHGAVIKALLCHLTETPFEALDSFFVTNCHLIVLEDGRLISRD